MIIVGTAGYSYSDWIGPIYPKGLDKKEMLPYYAQHFSFTEVNSSFYQMPNRFMLYHMQQKTPDGFRFAVKAYRGFTHEGQNLEALAEPFIDALQPLLEAGKLACILAQFPNSFHNTRENREHLVRLRRAFSDLPVVVEFRHRSWAQQEAVFRFLDDWGFGFVCVDAPGFKNLFPPLVRVTGPIAYVRFHGRNYEKWWNHEKPYERYNYLYSQQELLEWVPKLRELEEKAGTVYAVMNNHYQGQAYVNAKQLQQLLEM